MSLRGLIPCVPAPNHLKLVNDAYPSSKQVIEPDSNGLGKLTFYTKSRPIKLAKVADALLKRSQRSSEPVNSLCVTLTVLKKLLEECRNDVNVFSEQTITIISIAVKRRASESNAQELLERAAGTFYALVTFAKLAALDERSYIALLADFGNLAKDGQSMQYRLIGLHALQGAAESEMLYAPDFRKQIGHIIPAVLDDIIDSDATAEELDQMLRSDKASQQDVPQSPNRPVSDRRARSIRIAKGLEGTEKPPGSREVGRQACKALQTILHCSSHNQLEEVLSCLLEYVERKNPNLWQNSGWFTWLAEKCLEWTQPQYRSLHVQFWLDQLTALNGGASSKSAAKHEAILAVVTSLLMSPIAVVTPTISDTLASLSALVVRQPKQRGLVDAIVALSSHTYYPEQLSDMIADLLKDATEVYTAGHRNVAVRAPAVVALLMCIQEVLRKVASARFNTIRPSYDQLFESLIIMDSEDSDERTAYLAATQAIVSGSPFDPTVISIQTKTATSLPSIIVGSTDNVPGVVASSPVAQFARELQLRLQIYLQKDLPEQELQQLEGLLRAVYHRREANIVLEGIPIWLALSESSRSQGQSLASLVLQDAMITWECDSTPSTADAAIASLGGSRSLQEAAGISAGCLLEKLSKPVSTTSPVTAPVIETPSKRASSVRNSAAHRQLAAASEYGGRSRTSSIPTTSLADLKQSLAGGQLGNGSSNPAIPSHLQHERSGFSSPSRSIGARTSGASSVRSSVNGHVQGSRFGNTTPPPPEVNGQDHHTHVSVLHASSQSDTASPVLRTSSRKPRLDRILGSASNDTGMKAVVSSKHTGSAPHKFMSPPYQ